MNTQQTSAREWPAFGVAAVFTVLWVAATLILIASRRAEFGAILEPVTADHSRRTLNEIGDLLSGVAAPLAFVWLLTATVLQRRELKLQREELRDTRLEMRETRAEHAKAAAESAHQTKIMQATLEASRTSDIYEEHKQIAYYFAKFITEQSTSVAIRTPDGGDTAQIYHPISNFRLEDTLTSVDAVLGQLAYSLDRAYQKLSAPNVGITARKEEARAVLLVIIGELETLVETPRYATNPLVAARLRGTELGAVLSKAKRLLHHLDAV